MTASKTTLHGAALLNDAKQNKGTAFTQEERSALGLDGLLPQAVETLDRQFEPFHKTLNRT